MCVLCGATGETCTAGAEGEEAQEEATGEPPGSGESTQRSRGGSTH